MARTRQATPQTREERLRKKREAERKRYQRLKQNPVGREQLRQKGITQYLKKKEKNIIKPFRDLSERDQRRKRKQWREYSQTYRNKNKQRRIENEYLIQRMHEDTPPISEEEQDRVIIVPATPEENRMLSVRRRCARNRKKRSRENNQKGELIRKLKLKVQKYKQKYYLLKKIKTKNNPPTPSRRVTQIMDKDKNVVAKKLLFAEVISDQLKSNYENLSTTKEKQIFRKVVSGAIVKKYRVKQSLKAILRGSRVSGSTKKDFLHYSRKTRNSCYNKRNAIWRFLENDFYSKLCPGKKDYCRKNKVIKQKRYLCNTMRNLHKKFLICYPDMPISYAFWCKNRPFWIVKRKVTARDTCGCTYCINIALLVQALHRMGVFHESNISDVTKAFCCQEKTEKCLLRECTGCKDNIISHKPYEGTRNGYFFKWGPKKDCFFDKKTQKEKIVIKTIKQKYFMPLDKIILEFETSMTKFLRHKGRSLHQHIQISGKKATLNQNEIMLHMDFSENYSLKYAEETQAFHFGGSRQQISLHTVVIYFRSKDTIKSKSFCTLSKSLRHDVPAIWAHLQPILIYISEVHSADTLFFVSDSPSGQYRNKTMFYFLATKLHHFYPNIKKCSWNYLESGHGKGAPDGIGGVTKRTADRLVAEGRDICSFEILLKSLQENVPNVSFFPIDDKSIKNVTDLIKKDDIKPFAGTMQAHQVKLTDYAAGTLRFLLLSCFEVEDPNYLIGTLDYSNEKEYVQIEAELSSDSEDDLALIHFVPKNANQKINYSDVYSDDEAGPSTRLNDQELVPTSIKIGAYVLIEYKTGRASYRYVGIVQNDTDDDEVKVMFLKVCKFRNSQAFRANENDVAFVNYDQILLVLPSPDILV